MVTPTIFGLSIDCNKKKCSIFNNLRDTDPPKSSTVAKHLTIFTFLYIQSIKDRTFFLFVSIDNQKIVGLPYINVRFRQK